jgi:hypothetical protein
VGDIELAGHYMANTPRGELRDLARNDTTSESTFFQSRLEELE